jgi:hypothetical protein
MQPTHSHPPPRWCREPVYTSWWAELAARSALLLRHLLLTLLPYSL